MTAVAMDAVMEAVARHLSSARWSHTVGVAETAVTLAVAHGVDPFSARLAGLLHDYARELPPAVLVALAREHHLGIDAVEAREPLLLHGRVGAALVRERFGVGDPDLLAAIAMHITGAPQMSLLARIIFLADFCEPGRTFAAARQARETAGNDLPEALLIAYDTIIAYIVADGYLLHPLTVAARNELLFSMGGATAGR